MHGRADKQAAMRFWSEKQIYLCIGARGIGVSACFPFVSRNCLDACLSGATYFRLALSPRSRARLVFPSLVHEPSQIMRITEFFCEDKSSHDPSGRLNRDHVAARVPAKGGGDIQTSVCIKVGS